MIAKRSEAASVPGRLCDIAGKQLDGRITVLSNEPKGAAIHIEVPLDPFHHNE